MAEDKIIGTFFDPNGNALDVNGKSMFHKADPGDKFAASKLGLSVVDTPVRKAMPRFAEIDHLNVRPNSILLYRIYSKELTAGGIILPQKYLDEGGVEVGHKGVVMVAGQEASDLGIAYGTFVEYNQFAGRLVVCHRTGAELILIGITDVHTWDVTEFDGYENGKMK